MNSSRAKKIHFVGALLALACIGPTPAAADPITFQDSDFSDSNWSIFSDAAVGGSTHSEAQDTSADVGHPSPYRRMQHLIPIDPAGQGNPTSISVLHLYSPGVYTPSSSGAIDHVDLAMDQIVFSVTPGPGAVGNGFFLVQDGVPYFASAGAFTSSSWESHTATGLVATDFVHASERGSHPDFSATASPIQFGYARSNSNTGQGADVTTVHGADNFSVIITPRIEPIRVLTLDESRCGTETNSNGSINFNFVTGGGHATLRNAVLAPANFGPGGTIERPVELLPAVPAFTTEALRSVDVVIVPHATNTDLSGPEIDALSCFVESGGGLIAFYNKAAVDFAAAVGATAGGFSSDDTVRVANASSCLVNGPFGAIPDGTMQAKGFAGYFESLGPRGELGLDLPALPGKAVGASFTHGQGRAAIFTDEEIFLEQTVPGIGVGHLSANTQTIFLNSLACVAPSSRVQAICTPAELSIAGIAAILLLATCTTVKQRRRRPS